MHYKFLQNKQSTHKITNHNFDEFNNLLIYFKNKTGENTSLKDILEEPIRFKHLFENF